MSKVTLMILDHAVIPVTEALATSRVFHPIHSHLLRGDASRRVNEWQEWVTKFNALERRILTLMEDLDIEPGAPPERSPHLIAPRVAELDIERLEHEAEMPLRELEAAQRRLSQLQRYHDQLTPIADLDVDLGTLRNLRYTFAMLGNMPLTNVERLQSSLEHIPFVLVPLRQDENHVTVMLFGQQRDAEILSRAARSAYLNPLPLPENYRGTPAEALEALNAGIERARQHIQEWEQEIAHLHEMRIKHLRYILWRVRASRKLAETIAGYEHLNRTYLVTGWVPASEVSRLETEIVRVSGEVVIEVSAPDHDDVGLIPASLNNPPLLQAFQGLVTNYGQPAYDELDPTPVLALTFPLVFGIMFGDVGHGLLLALAGLLLMSGRVRALRKLRSMGVVVAACGVAAMGFGFLYGSLFGSEEILAAQWLHPLENITDILLASVFIGAGLLSLGMVHNMANAALKRRWGTFLFDHNGLAGLLFYWSLIGLAAAGFGVALPLPSALLGVLAVISGAAFTFAEPLTHLLQGHRPLIEDPLGTYLMQAFFELFETLIGILSNTLSYVRMGAFAVAHGALSLVIFILADLASPHQGWLYYLVLVLGNLFVVGFEGMIVGIQTLRLEYYEFFSKFFSGNGVPYRPLTLISDYED